MRYPEQIICRAVSATPATARHLGFRLFPMIVPTSAELPFATYQRIGVTRLAALGNPVGIPTVSMSLTIYAESYSQVRELADAMRELLDHFSGNTLGVEVSQVTIEGESEDIVQLEGGDLPPAWVVTFSLSVEWQEIT
jgi:hypothetical protein